MSETPLTPFCCAKCGAQIGQQTDSILMLGDNEFFFPIKFRSRIKGCGHRQRWTPRKVDDRLLGMAEAAKAHVLN